MGSKLFWPLLSLPTLSSCVYSDCNYFIHEINNTNIYIYIYIIYIYVCVCVYVYIYIYIYIMLYSHITTIRINIHAEI